MAPMRSWDQSTNPTRRPPPQHLLPRVPGRPRHPRRRPDRRRGHLRRPLETEPGPSHPGRVVVLRTWEQLDAGDRPQAVDHPFSRIPLVCPLQCRRCKRRYERALKALFNLVALAAGNGLGWRADTSQHRAAVSQAPSAIEPAALPLRADLSLRRGVHAHGLPYCGLRRSCCQGWLLAAALRAVSRA
jgi:hypothetical protein